MFHLLIFHKENPRSKEKEEQEEEGRGEGGAEEIHDTGTPGQPGETAWGEVSHLRSLFRWQWLLPELVRGRSKSGEWLWLWLRLWLWLWLRGKTVLVLFQLALHLLEGHLLSVVLVLVFPQPPCRLLLNGVLSPESC